MVSKYGLLKHINKYLSRDFFKKRKKKKQNTKKLTKARRKN